MGKSLRQTEEEEEEPAEMSNCGDLVPVVAV